jgi:hypothetical protein
MKDEFVDVEMTCRGCGKRIDTIPNCKKGTKITGLHKECREQDSVFIDETKR